MHSLTINSSPKKLIHLQVLVMAVTHRVILVSLWFRIGQFVFLVIHNLNFIMGWFGFLSLLIATYPSFPLFLYTTFLSLFRNSTCKTCPSRGFYAGSKWKSQWTQWRCFDLKIQQLVTSVHWMPIIYDKKRGTHIWKYASQRLN